MRSVSLLLCLYMLAVVVLLAGCGKQKEKQTDPPPVLSGITFDAVITCPGGQYACRANAGRGGLFTVEVTKPETISGLTLEWDGEDLTVRYLGLSYRPNLGDSVFTDTLRALKNAMDAAAAAAEANGAGSGGRIDGSFGGEQYQLYLSVDGLPLRLEVPSVDLAVDFQNVRVAA